MWLPGFAFFLAAVYQLAQYCVVGTVVEVMNDQSLIAIYEVQWHLMNKEEGHDLIFMMAKAQNPNQLFIAGLYPVNVATFQQVS